MHAHHSVHMHFSRICFIKACMVMRGNAYPWTHAYNIVSQGFIQDFSKGGGELNDVHPLNLCSLMRI